MSTQELNRAAARVAGLEEQQQEFVKEAIGMEKREKRMLNALPIVISIATLVVSLLGGLILFGSRLAVDEDHNNQNTAAIARLNTKVDKTGDDVTDVKADVRWIVKHIDRPNP